MSRELTPAQKTKALRDLYATLPKIQCQGKCWQACTSIDMSNHERKVLKAKTGIVVLPNVKALHGKDEYLCPLLDKVSHRCKGYQWRPAVCRTWGLDNVTKCPEGCTPERVMTYEEVVMFLEEANAIGGKSDRVDIEEIRALVRSESGRAFLKAEGERLAAEEAAWWQRKREMEGKPTGATLTVHSRPRLQWEQTR